LVSGGWYIITGLIDLLLGGWGLFIYNTYNFGLASGTDKTLHPYAEWTLASYVIMGPNFFFLFFWTLNLFLDHNAGFLDGWVLRLSKFMILAPFAYMTFAFFASSSYGTDIEVALGTDWAFVITDDPDYSLIFNVTMLLSILNFLYVFMARSSMQLSYTEKQDAELEAARDAATSAEDKIFSGDCKTGMIEDPKTSLCYYPKTKDWDWDTDTARL
jgi:hypothetical protein